MIPLDSPLSISIIRAPIFFRCFFFWNYTTYGWQTYNTSVRKYWLLPATKVVGFKGTEGSGSAHFSKIRILADAIWALMRCSLNFAGNGFRQAPEDSPYRSRSAVNVGAVNPTDTVYSPYRLLSVRQQTIWGPCCHVAWCSWSLDHDALKTYRTIGWPAPRWFHPGRRLCWLWGRRYRDLSGRAAPRWGSTGR